MAPEDPRFGKLQPCPDCQVDYSASCGLSAEERQLTVQAIKMSDTTNEMLRWLVTDCIERPIGMVTLWGPFGTAKTMAVQTVVAELVRRRRHAKFIRAKAIEQGWFDDMHAEKSNMKGLLTVPVLAIDELDKVNTKSDWVRQQFQQLMDERYVRGVEGKLLTLITLNGKPEDVLPGDVASRMGDGRFYRQWTSDKQNPYVIKRWGVKALPGVVEIKGMDFRPYNRPDWAEQER